VQEQEGKLLMGGGACKGATDKWGRHVQMLSIGGAVCRLLQRGRGACSDATNE